MLYLIFGKNIQLVYECIEVKPILERELSIYPIIKNESADIKIIITDKFNVPSKNYSINPKIHKTLDEGFISIYPNGSVYFKKNDKLEIVLEVKNDKNYSTKFKSYGYRNLIESIGQIFHELVLIPLVFYDPDKTIIHASGVKNCKTNKSILFGGTGGVGKTSLELLLCRELDYSFLADDMAIVSSNGHVYPNLSYPKIYAYNVEKNKKIKDLLFEKRSLLDKFQWEFFSKLKGLSRVRRAIAPNIIYNKIENESHPLDEYYILLKTNTVDKIKIEQIDFEKAAELTLNIIKNESHPLLQHIIWHEYNCSLTNISPIITLDNLYTKWIKLNRQIFKEIKNYVIKIPDNISHQDFLQQMREKF